MNFNLPKHVHVTIKQKQKWTPNIQIESQSLKVLESWESQSLGSPRVPGVSESQTINCIFADKPACLIIRLLFVFASDSVYDKLSQYTIQTQGRSSSSDGDDDDITGAGGRWNCIREINSLRKDHGELEAD